MIRFTNIALLQKRSQNTHRWSLHQRDLKLVLNRKYNWFVNEARGLQNINCMVYLGHTLFHSEHWTSIEVDETSILPLYSRIDLYTFFIPFPTYTSLLGLMYNLVCMEPVNIYITLVSTFSKSWTEVIQTRYIVSKIAPLYLILLYKLICISKWWHCNTC